MHEDDELVVFGTGDRRRGGYLVCPRARRSRVAATRGRRPRASHARARKGVRGEDFRMNRPGDAVRVPHTAVQRRGPPAHAFALRSRRRGRAEVLLEPWARFAFKPAEELAAELEAAAGAGAKTAPTGIIPRGCSRRVVRGGSWRRPRQLTAKGSNVGACF